MLKERNKRGCNRGNLLGGNIHEFYLRRGNYRIIGILTALDFIANKGTVIIQRGISLTNDAPFLFFGRKIYNFVIVKIGNRVLYLTIRSLYETELVYLCINAQ